MSAHYVEPADTIAHTAVSCNAPAMSLLQLLHDLDSRSPGKSFNSDNEYPYWECKLC